MVAFALIIKYLTHVICCCYLYVKLLNIRISYKSTIIGVVFALLIAYVSYCLSIFFPPARLIVMVILTAFLLSYALKTSVELAITTTIISFGISYVLISFLSLFISAILIFLDIDRSNNGIALLSLCIFIAQMLFMQIPFRFKRLKRGMPFLQSKGSSNMGVLISMISLCSVIILSNQNTNNSAFVLCLVLVLICGTLILIWWRFRLTRLYVERQRAEEMTRLNNAIQELELEIENLKRQNDDLAKIIHKDNKLIPAMVLAVKEYLAYYSGGYGDIREKGKELIARLDTMSRERTGILQEYQTSNKKLPLTDVFAVDSLISYMHSRATKSNIDLELTISGSIKYMIESSIADSDLCTLLADLIENAIISTADCNSKRVLIAIGIDEKAYFVDILDSGTSFEIDTILNLGLKKATTHADEGGSGIGLMTVYSIVKQYSASFMIEEFSDNAVYTKKISVKFDSLNRYIVKSARAKQITSASQRNDLLILPAL